MRSTKNGTSLPPDRGGRALATLYLEAVRNTAILVQIYLFHFVLAPIRGMGRFTVGVLSLSFFEATLAAEVMRGSIQAVQWCCHRPCAPCCRRWSAWTA